MQRHLYNVAFGLPDVRLPPVITLRLSRHAERAAADDRYGACNVPSILATAGLLVELETDGMGRPEFTRKSYTLNVGAPA